MPRRFVTSHTHPSRVALSPKQSQINLMPLKNDFISLFTIWPNLLSRCDEENKKQHKSQSESRVNLHLQETLWIQFFSTHNFIACYGYGGGRKANSNEMSYDEKQNESIFAARYHVITSDRPSSGLCLSSSSIFASFTLINFHSQLIKTKQPNKRFHQLRSFAIFFHSPFAAWPGSQFSHCVLIFFFLLLPLKYHVVPGTDRQTHKNT